jgi:predicted N-acyltransferase
MAKTPLKKLGAKLRDVSEDHALRHTPSGLSFAIADGIDLLVAADWDRVAARASFFMSRAYLRALESHPATGMSSRYALIYREREPVAAVALQILEVDGSRLMKVEKPKGKGKKRVAMAKTVRERLLVCGNILSWGFHGLAFADGVGDATLYAGVAEAIYRVRRAERLAGKVDFALVKDVTAAQLAAATTLKRFSYAAHATEPNMVLELQPAWRTFEDYLASLTSKYRNTTRKIVRGVEEAGLTVEVVRDLAPWADRVNALYMRVHGKATVRLATAHPGYLPAVAAAAGDGFKLTAIRRGEELVGFVTSIKDGDTAVGYFIGFDYELNETVPLYFRLLLATIEDAIAWRCARLSLGRTALEPKAKLGAKPEAMTVFVRHRVPVMNAVVKRFLKGLSHAEAPERSPFKD